MRYISPTAGVSETRASGRRHCWCQAKLGLATARIKGQSVHPPLTPRRHGERPAGYPKSSVNYQTRAASDLARYHTLGAIALASSLRVLADGWQAHTHTSARFSVEGFTAQCVLILCVFIRYVLRTYAAYFCLARSARLLLFFPLCPKLMPQSPRRTISQRYRLASLKLLMRPSEREDTRETRRAGQSLLMHSDSQ